MTDEYPMKLRWFHYLLLLCMCVCTLSSCGTGAGPQTAPVAPGMSGQFMTPFPVTRQDIVHTVGPLETVWRLSKMYDVSVASILQANNLSPDAAINKGQRLIIPRAAPMRAVVPLYASTKWKYIIIHHSATDEGNALEFDRAHYSKGWDGLGYHFVIDNGTKGKGDGQIEVSPRWIHQQDGAHCKAGNMNTMGIGICLVGNFSVDEVSDRQMDSLVYLVERLQNFYGIPEKNILGHSQVPGASTECPGLRFPWFDLKKRLH